MIYKDIVEMLGNTPIVTISKIKVEENVQGTLLAKLEKYNPTGSAKDRIAYYMLKDLLDKGIIKTGGTIIEPTSGNTGIGLAAFGKHFGLNVIIVMPSSMSLARRQLIKNYGATLVLIDGGMKQCVQKAIELHSEIENSYIPSQFDNENNIKAHYETTGPEIYKDVKDIDYFVAGIGTGGTISGVGKYLKEKNPNIKIIGVEPLSSPLINKGVTGPHKIQGIGANFIPDNFKKEYVDEVLMVSDEDAISMANRLVKEEGIYVGISSGATMSAMINIAKRDPNKKIVGLFADGGDRYEWKE